MEKRIDVSKNKGGRPTLYDGGMLEKARQYIRHFQDPGSSKMKTIEVIPSVAGLAIFLGVSKRVLYDWRDAHLEFLHTLEELQDTQESIVLSNGLNGSFNAPISKLVLANHGYSDKQVIDNTSSDGSMSAKPTTIVLTADDDSEY